MSETLYRKIGKKYVPAYSSVYDAYDNRDLMKVGTWRMTYAYSNGGRRYEYDVKPDTASFVAAAMLFRKQLEDAINEAAIAKPQLCTTTYTKKQLNLIEQFRKDMAEAGGLTPTHWTHATAYQISEAAINAMKGEL